MRLFTLWDRCFAPFGRRYSACSLDAAPLGPQRLERRRVLDASAAAVLLSPLAASSDYVQVGDSGTAATDAPPADSSDAAAAAASGNTPPSNIQFLPLGEVQENGVAQLLLIFDDPDRQDTHSVQIDWGDGTTVETIELAPGARFLSTTHRYLDDNPTGTPVDVNQVTVTIADSQGGSTSASTPITVQNVAPSNVQFAPLGTIDEGGTARLALLFDDPGTLDTHTVEIEWGDGSAVETIGLSAGSRFLSTTHQYLDDNPTGTPSDVYQVQVKILDDDGGATTASTSITVQNVAPTLSLGVENQAVDEGALLDLTGVALGTFTDAGVLDTHTATIDWGDGTPAEAVAVFQGSGAGTLGGAGHVFADNGVYTATVRVTDDDGGVVSRSFQVEVANVDPALLTLTATDIDRFGRASVSGTFNDPGFDNPLATPPTVESFVVEIDWRDGTVQQVFVGGPTPGGFAVVHNYAAPPDPLNPAADVEIKVRLLDDDGGLDTGSVLVTNPGKGTEPVRIDTTPQVPVLVFPPRVQSDLFFQVATSEEKRQQIADARAAVSDLRATSDRYLLLRYVQADGQLSAGFRLKPQVLNDLPALFRKLPDNHWMIYLVRTETNTSRLVLDVYVRNGKAIDPGDDTEGARDRPPTDETSHPRGKEPTLPDRPETNPAEPDAQPAASDDSAVPLTSNEPSAPVGWEAAAMGVAASAGCWAQQVDGAIAQAGPRQWRRLRRPRRRRDGRIGQKIRF